MSPPDAFPSADAQPVPADIGYALAASAERRGTFGRPVYWFAELSSTNDLAGELAERGADEGAVVIAGAQTAGRGRLGRAWQSPPGAGLYFSIVLRPHPAVLQLITLAAGVAVASAVQAVTGLEPTLKWPNDVYIDGRKLAGILAEGGASAAGVSHVVVGIGINLRPAAYPAEVAKRATSIAGELGRDVQRGVVLAECLAAFASRYDDLRNGRGDAVLRSWRSCAAPLLGRSVEWDERGAVRSGVAVDVDHTGALVVRTDEGMARVISGEVRWT